MVRAKGLEPPCREAPDPKSGASTNFATPALSEHVIRWVVLAEKACHAKGNFPFLFSIIQEIAFFMNSL